MTRRPPDGVLFIDFEAMLADPACKPSTRDLIANIRHNGREANKEGR